MYELLKGQVLVANVQLNEVFPTSKKLACVSAVDRKLNVIAIRPFGFDECHISLEAISVISLNDGSLIEGAYPVSDFALHLKIYQTFPQIEAITHCYQEWGLVFSQAEKSIPVLSKKHAALFKNEIPCTKGLEIEDTINALNDMEILCKGALLLKNDGLIAWDTTPLKSLETSKQACTIAKDTWDTLSVVKECESFAIPIEKALKIYQDNQENDAEFCKVGKPGQIVSESEQRKICMELIVYFDKVCREHGIKYSLTGGTLLGAVRHKGFIPWDDDVDVFLTRPEYDKLTAVFPDDNRFILINREKNKNFNYVFSRLIDTKTYITESPGTASFGNGVFLDICVVDGLPKSSFARKMHMKYMRFLVRGRRATIKDPHGKSFSEKGPIVYALKMILRSFIHLSTWNKWMAKAMKKYPFESSLYVGNFTSQYGKKELLHRNIFDNYIDVPFEGHNLMICEGYEEYLLNIYGKSYLSFPKKAKRKGHHPNKTYWVE